MGIYASHMKKPATLAGVSGLIDDRPGLRREGAGC